MKGTRTQVRRVVEEEKNKTIMKECVCCVCEEKKYQVKIGRPCGFLFLNQDLISFFL
jgi:hypothetical protein